MTTITNDGVTIDIKPTVYEAFSLVQGDVQAIEKGERNRDQNFNFRGIDTVVNNVGPVLRKYGVVILPTAEDIQLERYLTSKGSAMHGAVVRMRYTVYGPAGDSFSGVTYGQASDSGDKAVSKAQSVAYRVFLLQGLTIPTHEPDPDASSHERAADPEPETRRRRRVDPAQVARDELLALINRKGIHPDKASIQFTADTDGGDIIECTDPDLIRKQLAHYVDLPDVGADE